MGLAGYSGGQRVRTERAYPSGPGIPEMYPGGGGRYAHDEPNLSYGGVELEYLWQPAKLVHATVSTLIGGGRVANTVYYPVPLPAGRGIPPTYYGADTRDEFFVAEPAAHAEVNVAKYLRLSVGLGYRFTAGGDQFSTSASQARGATGSLSIKFGKL